MPFVGVSKHSVFTMNCINESKRDNFVHHSNNGETVDQVQK